MKFVLAATLILVPALFLFAVPPTSALYSPRQGQWLVTVSLYTLSACAFIGYRIGIANQACAKHMLPGIAATILLLVILKVAGLCALSVKLLLLCWVSAICGAYVALEKHIRLQGLVSLLLFVTFFGSLEAALRALPGATFAKPVASVPPLAPPDRGNELLRKHGFRGRQPCSDCAQKPVRVVTMGGSSTYGIPLPSAAQAFSEQLQRLLDEERPGTRHEVLNAGIPGYGIVQVVDSLEHYVLQFHPDYVVINSWFNDSAKGSGWYGYVGLSDREAQDKVALLRKIDASKMYRTVARLRLYGIFRHYLLQFTRREVPQRTKKAARKDRRRMDPAEFKLELERIVALGKAHNFRPVFMYEVTNRQEDLQTALRKNGYLRAVSEVAAASGAPLIDTITPFAERRGDWLFSDFIHPNRDGHRLLAQTIHQQLFSGSKE